MTDSKLDPKPTPSYPDNDQAYAFAVMLSAGLPASDAIVYFTDQTDPVFLAQMIAQWQKSRLVKRSLRELMGKAWQEMSLAERMQAGLDQHYNTLSYLLYSRNYLEADPATKGKLDSARVAIEARLAGQSGRSDALTRFFEDIQTGKLRLPGQSGLPN